MDLSQLTAAHAWLPNVKRHAVQSEGYLGAEQRGYELFYRIAAMLLIIIAKNNNLQLTVRGYSTVPETPWYTLLSSLLP
jgi:hypothetical protein